MARWSASLSSSVSSGEGGQAGDPMNCSEVKVKYLKVKVKHQKMMLWDSLVCWSPDKILDPLQLFPAGSRALLLSSPPTLCPGPSARGSGEFTEEKGFLSDTNLATALTTSVSDLICKEDRAIT